VDICDKLDCYSSCKFRFPKGFYEDYCFEQFIDIIPEIYSASRSHESRLILGPGGGFYTVNFSVYLAWTNMIINVRAEDPLSLKDYLVCHSLLVGNYFMSFFNLTNRTILALFTLGLNSEKERVYSLLENNQCIANFIGKNYFFHFDTTSYDRLNDVVANFGYFDHVYDINKMLYNLNLKGHKYWGFTSRDFVTMSMYQFGGLLRRDAIGAPITNINSKQAAAWFVIVHNSFVHMDTWTQNWQNSQTNLVKMFTPMIRSIMELDDKSLHYWRQLAIIKRFPEATLYDDLRINAKVDGIYIAVAGHPLNMLIASNFINIDMFRYTRTLVNNVRAAEMNDFSFELDMLNYGLNSERPMVGLWHNNIEYSLAVDTYNLMVEKKLFYKQKYAVKIMLEAILECSKYDIFFTQSQTANDRLGDKEHPLIEMNADVNSLEAMIDSQILGFRKLEAEKSILF